MNSNKSLAIIIVCITIIFSFVLFYSFSKISDLEERLSDLEQKIESPQTKIIPLK